MQFEFVVITFWKIQAKILYLFVKLDLSGVLMWEVFTCGKMPYGRLKNTEVVERVQRGIILERPKACAKEIYEVIISALFSMNNFNFMKSILNCFCFIASIRC